MQKNPDLWVKIIIAVNVVFYIISLVILRQPSGNPFDFFSPSGSSLLLLGGSGSIPVLEYHRYFSIVNANFLHASVLHIGFNMVALWQLFRPVGYVYGTDRALIIYLVSGFMAFLISSVAHVEFTVGASGAVCGLMGALLYFAKSRGDLMGQKLFKEIVIWIVILFAFGFTAGGVNNLAHGAGIVCGALLGFLLNFRRRETVKEVLASSVCILITVLCLLYGLITTIGVLLRISVF